MYVIKNLFKNRYILLAIFFIILTLILLGNLVDLQIVNGQEYLEQSKRKFVSHNVLYAPRGNIYDRNGIPIAGSRLGFFIHYTDAEISNEYKNEMFLNLMELFKRKDVKLKKSLTKKITINPIAYATENVDGFINSIAFSQSDKDDLTSAEKTFEYLREKVYKIDQKYTVEQAYEIMILRYELQTGYKPFFFAEDVDELVVAEIEERSNDFIGIGILTKPVRTYIEPSAVAHILGYVGLVNESDLLAFREKYPEKNYKQGDFVGILGVERSAEKYLRGINGETTKEVDEEGRVLAHWVNKEPVKGQDVYLTVDLELQRAAVESLEKNIERIKNIGGKKNFGDANAGAVVAIDIKNGEVLALASYPYYDPTVFLENNSQEIIRLFNDEDRALWNRATNGTYAPGSTYKPLIEMADIQEKIITPPKLINCPYKEEIGERIFTNLEGNQGYINLEKALATSSNMYFYKVGVETGIDNIVKWAKEFGFGQKTGIEISEDKGQIASRELKKSLYNEPWFPANTAMSSIGQLYNAFTPLQIANYTATIANEGIRNTPHIIKKVAAEGDEVVNYIEATSYTLPVDKKNIEAVKKGMVAVANDDDGTAARQFQDFPFKVAGKTGTAEHGNELKSSSNALFICYAPADDPQIAVAVVVEKGVWGAYTAPIARDVLKTYFNLNNGNIDSDQNDKEEYQIVW